MAEYIIDKIAYNGNVYKLQDNQSGYITTETDPVFNASPAAGISATDISNWNGKSDTDEKLQTNTNYSLNYSYKLIFGAASNSPSTKFYSQNLNYSESDSTATIRLGGSTKLAQLTLASGNNHTITLYPDSNMTSSLYIQLPDKNGTVALTSDVPSISLNGSSTTSASFYAPTTAGTSGYMLVSNGSGAPTWAQAIPATSTYNGNTLTISNQNGTFSVESEGSSNLNVGFSVSEDGVGIYRYKASLASIASVLGYDFTNQETIVTELRTPTNNTDAATKKYVDDAVAGAGSGVTVTLNGSITTTPSFYAPTTAGTSGQVLTSNGSGAPTWAAQSEDIFVAEYNPQTETGTPFNDIKEAYEAGKHVILDVSAQDSIHTFLPLVLIMDMLTSETPYATAGFSIVQNGNVSGALVSVVCTVHPDPEDSSQFIEEWEHFDFDVQPELSSGTNIKTINNQSILGSGNLTISGGSSTQIVTWTEV